MLSSASNDNLKDVDKERNGVNKVNKSLSSSHLSSGLNKHRPSSSRSSVPKALNALSDETESEEDEESSPVIDDSNKISTAAAPTAPYK